MFMPVANRKYIGREDQVFLCGLLWGRLVVFRRAELYDIDYKGMKSKIGMPDIPAERQDEGYFRIKSYVKKDMFKLECLTG